jgi:hypothetical protein
MILRAFAQIPSAEKYGYPRKFSVTQIAGTLRADLRLVQAKTPAEPPSSMPMLVELPFSVPLPVVPPFSALMPSELPFSVLPLEELPS